MQGALSQTSNLLNNLSSLSKKKKKYIYNNNNNNNKNIIFYNVGLKLLDPGPCDKKWIKERRKYG